MFCRPTLVSGQGSDQPGTGATTIRGT
jgi:hypothetical protein